jgi:hypothetical protein
MFPDYVYFCGTPGGDFMTCPRSNQDILEFKKGSLPKTKRGQSLRDAMARGQSPRVLARFARPDPERDHSVF